MWYNIMWYNIIYIYIISKPPQTDPGTSCELAFSWIASLSHDLLLGMTVDSPSATLPAKTARFCPMNSATASQARLWQSWGYENTMGRPECLIIIHSMHISWPVQWQNEIIYPMPHIIFDNVVWFWILKPRFQWNPTPPKPWYQSSNCLIKRFLVFCPSFSILSHKGTSSWVHVTVIYFHI